MQEFIDRSRYYLAEEYITKIRHCLLALPGDAVWKRPNDSSNSIGNLVLHLAGNVRQWIVAGVGGAQVRRNRDAEFAANDGGDAQSLLDYLEGAVREVDGVLAALSPDQLREARTIQGRNTTVFSAIYHVVEHFAMHTGQIVLLTKIHAPGAISFYRDTDGSAKPVWGGNEGIP